MLFLSNQFTTLGADPLLPGISLQVSVTGIYDSQFDDRAPDAPAVPINGVKIKKKNWVPRCLLALHDSDVYTKMLLSLWHPQSRRSHRPHFHL